MVSNYSFTIWYMAFYKHGRGTAIFNIVCYVSLQLGAAVENLKHIFNVPETVKKCEDLINDGKLLHAHKWFVPELLHSHLCHESKR